MLPIQGGGAAAVVSPAWGSPAAVAAPSDHPCMIIIQLSLGLSLSLCHSCMHGNFSSCLLAREALHETEESRTHHARLIPLAAVTLGCLINSIHSFVSLSPPTPQPLHP